MSALDKLTFTAPPKRAARSESPVTRFIEAVDHQIACAAAHKDGKEYTVDRVVYVGEGDDRKKVVEPRTLRPWFGEASNGEWFVAVRYGNRPLKLGQDGAHAVVCKKFGDVVTVLGVLKTAAQNGELDDALAAARAAAGNKKKN